MKTSSLTFKVPNTRGFNIPNNIPFHVFIDGVIWQAVLCGCFFFRECFDSEPTELDVESVRMLPGSSSAY